MKSLNLLLACSIFLACSSFLFSQSLERSVVSTQGSDFQNANLRVSWTLGEPVSEVISSSQNQLDQGYQQALDAVISLREQGDVRNPIVFPNPFSDVISIENIPPGNCTILLLQADAKEVLRVELKNETFFEFPTADLPKGSYVIKLITEESHATYTLIKAH